MWVSRAGRCDRPAIDYATFAALRRFDLLRLVLHLWLYGGAAILLLLLGLRQRRRLLVAQGLAGALARYLSGITGSKLAG